MKKVLIIFNEIVTPTRVLQFALNTAKENGAMLAGIFLKELSEESAKYPFINDLKATEEEQLKNTGEKDEPVEINTAAHFEQQCKEAGVQCSVEENIPISELAERSADADLAIVDARVELEGALRRNLFEAVKCPLYIGGLNAPDIEKVYLFQDGEEAQNAAQKAVQLFPAWKHLPAILLTDEKDAETNSFTNLFPQVTQQTISNGNGESLVETLKEDDKNAVIIMDLQHQNILSRLLHPDRVYELINETRASFFVVYH